MNNAKKIKIYFSMLIIFFIITLVGGQYYYSQYGFSTEGINYEFIKTPSADIYQDYYISLPKDSIIIRLDDAGAWHYNQEVEKIANDVTSRNLSLVIAVIPEKISHDTVFLDYMRELLENPNIEVAMHGYTHSEEEFKNASLEQATEWIQKGKQEIIQELKVVPITFIPPYNVYSPETITALKQENFKVIAGAKGEYSMTHDFLILGYTTRTSDYSVSDKIPVKRIIQECETSLKEREYCEIMIHPQDFLSENNPGELDIIRYTQFLILLDELNKLQAESTTFKEHLIKEI